MIASSVKYTTFISYSHNNRDVATRLHQGLEAHGVIPWMDFHEVRPGTHWDQEIQKALKTCSHLVLVHTAASFASKTVWDEWSYFLKRDKPVIPLIFEPVELPFRLERLHYVNFFERPFEEALEQLVKVLPHFSPTPSPNNLSISAMQRRAAQARPVKLKHRNRRSIQSFKPITEEILRELVNRDLSLPIDLEKLADSADSLIGERLERVSTDAAFKVTASSNLDFVPVAPDDSGRLLWLDEASDIVDSRFNQSEISNMLSDSARYEIDDDIKPIAQSRKSKQSRDRQVEY